MNTRKCTDEFCPCQDGDSCHYLPSGDTPAWPLPPGVKLLDSPPKMALRHHVTGAIERGESEAVAEKTYGPGWPD